VSKVLSLSLAMHHDEEGWFVEWDDNGEPLHFAQGNTEDECLANFFSSLDATMKLHMKEYGHIKGITKFMAKKRDLLKTMKTETARVKAGDKTATRKTKATLVDAGIITPKGRLRKPYK
jgi:predicted RNase H-like HicB family nuclease